MAKTKISEFSTTAGNNTDINSINIAEGCAPSGINNAIRELMRQLKEFQTGGAGDSVNSGGDFSVATNKFTVASASGNTAVAGTLAVTGVATLTAQPILSSLTASKAVFTDASKGLVSNDVTGTGNVVMSNSPTLVTPALGTPSSGVVTNLTGTASININGTVGATTPSTGAFTTLSSTGNTTLGDASGDTITINGTTTFVNANPTLSAGTANGVLYLNGSKVATAGSALVFDGTNFNLSSGYFGIAAQKVIGSGNGYAGNTLAASSGTLELWDTNGHVNLYNNWGSGAIKFGIGGSEAVRLTSTGLGIGTSSPSAKLDVVNSGVSQIQIKNSSGTTRNTQLMFADNSAIRWRIGMDIATNNNTNIFQLYNDTAAAAAFSVDTSGNLGIGTSSITSGFRLDVQATRALQLLKSTTGTNDVFQRYNNTGGSFTIGIDDSAGANQTGSAYASYFWSTVNSPMIFATNNAERARIDSSGNLLVGTTSAGTGAIVDVQSTTKGVRFPNMTTTQKNAITPAAGTVVFDTTLAKLCVYSGSAWQTITSV